MMELRETEKISIIIKFPTHVIIFFLNIEKVDLETIFNFTNRRNYFCYQLKRGHCILYLLLVQSIQALSLISIQSSHQGCSTPS